jgi:hypothetical protein
MAQLEALLTAARTQDRAPGALRARIERERAAARPARRRAVYAGGLVGALAAAAIALALILPTGTPGAPSVSEAAALGFRPAVQPPPPPNGQKLLQVNVDEVYFPRWEGWRAVGKRTDRFAGRPAVTVYYARGTALVAYTIVGVPALPVPQAPTVRAGWLTVRTMQVSGRAVVSWLRSGDTCVLSSRQLSVRELAVLAADEDSRHRPA